MRSQRWKPIGKANAGQAAARAARAKTLERLLFERARGKEGSLAILVQLYLGLRPSEVPRADGGSSGRIHVFVNGTKNQNAKRRLELFAPVAKLLAKALCEATLCERIFAADRDKQPSPNWM